ncbi:MAG: LacI family DNA-binding transcriptional regulator [Gulosibacter sp.]|uniref:LacI family DNA-binding transcriptional regulator n=1 Tax=Gulosibacter sp. TaxID=2817531 RepID=UPI003F908667
MSTEQSEGQPALASAVGDRRPTIRDVAKRAGVSPSTVSHALSGRRTISESTKQRVFAAVDELGYGADPIASSLRRGRTQLIGLVLRPKDAVRGSLGGTENFLRLIGASAATALDRGWGLVHIPNTIDDCDTTLPVDGYIVAHPYEQDPILAQLRRTRRPVVTIDALDDDREDGWDINIDYVPGTLELLSGIDPKVARTTALITGTERNHWNRAVLEGASQWAGGLDRLFSVTELYEGEGVQGAKSIAESLLVNGVTGILTAASRFAVGAAQAAHELGVDIPGDVQIASFTDSSMAATNRPSITALDIQLDLAGAAGVELMLERLAGLEQPIHARTVTPVIRWRESTRQ